MHESLLTGSASRGPFGVVRQCVEIIAQMCVFLQI